MGDDLSIQSVIFDMDGLMLDTEPIYRIAWGRSVAGCGYVFSEEIRRRLIGLTATDAEQVLLREYGQGFCIETFRAFRRQYEPEAFDSHGVNKKPGLDALLSLLLSRRMTIAVATSASRERALPLLKRAELADKFHTIVTGDEVSAGKPSPDLFLLAAERIDTEPAHCLVLEDSEHGVVAACHAGMQLYVVPDLLQPSARAISMSNGVFTSLLDVARHLDQFLAV